MNRRALRALLPFAAFTLYAVRLAVVKHAVRLDRGAGEAGPMEAVFFYALLTFLVCGAMTLRDARRGRLQAFRDPRVTAWVALRGICGALSLACAFYGVAHIPLATNALIQNSSVFLTALLAWLFLGEAFTAATAAFCVLGYVGLALCVTDSLSQSGGGEWLGYAVSSGSLLLDATVYVAIRKARAAGTYPTVLANAVFSFAVCGAWFARHPFHVPGSTAALGAFLAAATSGLVANILFTESLLRAASAVAVATAKYAAPVFLAAVGWLCFREPMSGLQILGYCLALASGIATQWPAPSAEAPPRSGAGVPAAAG